ISRCWESRRNRQAGARRGPGRPPPPAERGDGISIASLSCPPRTGSRQEMGIPAASGSSLYYILYDKGGGGKVRRVTRQTHGAEAVGLAPVTEPPCRLIFWETVWRPTISSLP